MSASEQKARIARLRRELGRARKELHLAIVQTPPEAVLNYAFAAHDDAPTLASLFGDKRDLIIIHNMGSHCPMCTLWADGYNGLYPHIRTRASFVLTSPDEPAHQEQFARERGWQFPMISHKGTSFASDMGYADAAGRCRPGLSAFQMRDGHIVRTAHNTSEPFDDYCPVWHLFDLFPEGSAGWSPKLKYA